MTAEAAPPPPFIEAPALKRFSLHIRHGFFGRRGGVSTGIYRSLNCGYGSADDNMKVRENRRRVCLAMGVGADRLATVYQVHSARAVVVGRGASTRPAHGRRDRGRRRHVNMDRRRVEKSERRLARDAE